MKEYCIIELDKDDENSEYSCKFDLKAAEELPSQNKIENHGKIPKGATYRPAKEKPKEVEQKKEKRVFYFRAETPEEKKLWITDLLLTCFCNLSLFLFIFIFFKKAKQKKIFFSRCL